MRRGYAHLAEKNIRKFLIVVLAGVHQYRLDLRMTAHFAHQRTNLWEVGAGAYNIKDFELSSHDRAKALLSSLARNYNIAVKVAWQARIAVRA
jgi:hypothetical protein